MKRLIFERYKLINIISCFIVALITLGVYYYIAQGYCIDNCSTELKKGVLNPIYSGGKLLTIILAILLLFPSHIFKKWLFFVAPPILLLTYVLVSGISVYSGNLLNPTRAQMAENCMILLAVVTALLVIGYLLYDWKRSERINPKQS
jgi:hypothetical protein